MDFDKITLLLKEKSGPLHPEATETPARLAPLANIRAVLFDVYGTLLISGSGDIGVAAAHPRGEALADTLQQAGFHLKEPDDVIRQGPEDMQAVVKAYHGRQREQGADFPEVDIREVWETLLGQWSGEGQFLKQPEPWPILEIAVDFECRVNPVWPMPEAESCLDALHAKGLPLGIVSNAQVFTPLLFPALMGRRLDELGFSEELCLWSYQIRRAKPSRAMFADVLEVLQREHAISPQEVLYVGNDMRNDIWTAQSAGCRSALFAGDRRSLRLREKDPDCAGLEPDLVLTRLSQLPPLL